MSSTGSGNSDPIVALDQSVGDDGDAPGIAQPITQAEIDDILNDTTMPIEERRAQLERLAAELGERDEIDRGGDFDPLEAQIMEALSLLAEGGHAYGTPESTGMDPDSRSDAQAPDDQDDER